MKQCNQTLLSFWVIVIFLLSGSLAWGADIVGSDDVAAYSSLTAFKDLVTDAVALSMVNADLNSANNMIFLVFALTLIFWGFYRWNFLNAEQGELFSIVILIGMVKVIMLSYDTLTTGIWDWFQGLAEGIQQSFINSKDPVEISVFILNMVESIVIQDEGESWWSITSVNAVGWVAMVLFAFMAFLVSIMAFFATAWGVWGYALTKAVGWFLIPFLLFDRLSFIFEGWLKLFLGFCFYSLLARINLLLMAMALKSFLNVAGPISKGTVIEPMVMNIDSFADLSGIGSLVFIGLLALISTGQFSTSIAGGAGGLGQALQSVTRSVRALR